MALTGTTSGSLHPGSGARGITAQGVSSDSIMYTCPAGKIAYISAGHFLKIDGMTFPHWATGGATSTNRTVPFYLTAGQYISSSSGNDAKLVGIEFDA